MPHIKLYIKNGNEEIQTKLDLLLKELNAEKIDANEYLLPVGPIGVLKIPLKILDKFKDVFKDDMEHRLILLEEESGYTATSPETFRDRCRDQVKIHHPTDPVILKEWLLKL